MQQRYLEDIRQGFGNDVLAHVPELERDVTGLEMIERVADLMYGDEKD
jgi:anion-transporting  ArsA/GET3 family ATPase